MKVIFTNVECENCNPRGFSAFESDCEVHCVGCGRVATPGHGRHWRNRMSVFCGLGYLFVIFVLMRYYDEAVHSTIEAVALQSPSLSLLFYNPIFVYLLVPMSVSWLLGFLSANKLAKESNVVSCKK